MRRRYIIMLVILVALLGAGGIVFYYHYQGVHYISTDDARIAADSVTVTPELSGKLLTWKVQEGDTVQEGQVLGSQDLASTMQSSAINPQSLGPTASVLAQRADIKAPISGRVIQSRAVTGQMAAPGTPLAIIADLDNLYVSANIKEVSIERVKVDQVVDIGIDAYPGRHFTGRVESIGQATTSVFSLLPAQNTNGNFTKVTQVIPVRIHLLDAQGLKLLPGMNVSVRIHVS